MNELKCPYCGSDDIQAGGVYPGNRTKECVVFLNDETIHFCYECANPKCYKMFLVVFKFEKVQKKSVILSFDNRRCNRFLQNTKGA